MRDEMQNRLTMYWSGNDIVIELNNRPFALDPGTLFDFLTQLGVLDDNGMWKVNRESELEVQVHD